MTRVDERLFMTRNRNQLLTLATLWTSLALAYGIAVNRIDDTVIQVVLSLLYGVAVYAITRLVNVRRT
jgi:hypothetical protein